MTEDELAALEALTAAATPGPWEWSDYDHDLHAVAVTAFEASVIDPAEPWTMERIIVTDGGCYPPEKDDAAFIAAARTAVPALIAEVRRLRAKVPYNGQGFVNSAGLYTDAEGRTHPLRE